MAGLLDATHDADLEATPCRRLFQDAERSRQRLSLGVENYRDKLNNNAIIVHTNDYRTPAWLTCGISARP